VLSDVPQSAAAAAAAAACASAANIGINSLKEHRPVSVINFVERSRNY